MNFCLQWPLMQGYNELTQTSQWVQKFHCNWLQMFGWNLFAKVWSCNVRLHHQPHVWFWTPICKKWVSYPWGVASRTKCCLQHENRILFAWRSPTSLHLHPSTPLAQFEVLWKNDGGPFHLFGGNPPIMRPLFTLSLGPFSSSILLWFIQTLILRWNKFFLQIKVCCRFITFHVFRRSLLQRYRINILNKFIIIHDQNF